MASFLSTTDGECYYRTRPISRSRAFSFAKCLDANRRFTRVSVVRAISGSGWHVIYQPASQKARHRLYLVQYRARELRAAAEGAAYRFSLAVDAGFPVYRCRSASGRVYEVTQASCSCPDFQKRGQRSGVPCKHLHAYRSAVAGGALVALTRHRLAQVTGIPL
jgi:predicted nucleic acid-binding Zn finger protein